MAPQHNTRWLCFGPSSDTEINLDMEITACAQKASQENICEKEIVTASTNNEGKLFKARKGEKIQKF